MRISDWSSDVCSSDLRGPSPLTADFWQDGMTDIAAVATQVIAAPAQWWQSVAPRRSGPVTLLQVAVVALIAVVVLVIVQRPLSRHFGVDPAMASPAPARRTFAAFVAWLNATAVPMAVLWSVDGVLATEDRKSTRLNSSP